MAAFTYWVRICCYGPTTTEIDVQAWKQFYMANHTNQSGHTILGGSLRLGAHLTEEQ